MRRLSTLIVVLVVLQVGLSAVGAQPRFSVTPVGEMPGGNGYFVPTAINNAGQVIGNDGAQLHAFLWTPGLGTQSVPELPNDYPWIAEATLAYGLNDLGQVVGESNSAGFLWDSAQPGSPPINLRSSGDIVPAYAINNAGVVVGKTTGNAAVRRNSDGTTMSIPLPPDGYGEGTARAINEAGHVAGDIWRVVAGTVRDEWPEGNLWTGGSISRNLGLFQPTDQAGRGLDVNNRDHVVGFIADAQWNSSAFFWSEATGLHALPQLPFVPGDENNLVPSSSASAINDWDWIVGDSNGTTALWTPEDGVLPLDSLVDESGAGWESFSPVDINDKGQIVGVGVWNGASRAFVLTPVPEPGTLGVLLPLAAMGMLRRYVGRGKRDGGERGQSPIAALVRPGNATGRTVAAGRTRG